MCLNWVQIGAISTSIMAIATFCIIWQNARFRKLEVRNQHLDEIRHQFEPLFGNLEKIKNIDESEKEYLDKTEKLIIEMKTVEKPTKEEIAMFEIKRDIYKEKIEECKVRRKEIHEVFDAGYNKLASLSPLMNSIKDERLITILREGILLDDDPLAKKKRKSERIEDLQETIRAIIDRTIILKSHTK